MCAGGGEREGGAQGRVGVEGNVWGRNQGKRAECDRSVPPGPPPAAAAASPACTTQICSCSTTTAVRTHDPPFWTMTMQTTGPTVRAAPMGQRVATMGVAPSGTC